MTQCYDPQKEKTAPNPSIGVDGEQSIHNNNDILPQNEEQCNSQNVKNMVEDIVKMAKDFPYLPNEADFKMIRMSDIQAQEVQWLWYPYIPSGKITIMQGDPGEGKTFLILGITSYLTRGEALFHSSPLSPANVIYQTAEDGLADTIKPRLMSLGADCRRVLVIDESENPLSFCDQRIKRAIVKTKAKLLILDPLQAYLGADVDMHRANELRPVFSRLGNVAEETGCAIVIIGHMNKAGTKSTYKGLGSIDITAAARSVLVVGKSPEDENIRIMAHSKSNLAPSGSSIAFTFHNGLEILGESNVTLNELLGLTKAKRNVKEEAKELLEKVLSESSVEAKEIIAKSEKLNISERTLKTAKKELGVLSEKIGDSWFWKLP